MTQLFANRLTRALVILLPTLPFPFTAAFGALGAGAPASEQLIVPGRPEPVEGRLAMSAGGGGEFLPGQGGPPVALAAGMSIRFEAGPVVTGAGSPPFRVEMGLGQRLSGRLVAIDERAVTIAGSAIRSTTTIDRAGVASVEQRPGETIVLQDGFEEIDPKRWAVAGRPEVVEEPRQVGAHALRLPAGGASLTHQVAEPFRSGRFEAAFYDGGETSAADRWFLELTFRAVDGPETVRTLLGWKDAALAVESPGGPALAVQRLARSSGWHRLTLRFTPARLDVAVDGNELALGKGAGGPLVAIRIGTAKPGREETPAGLAGFLDDLRLVRLNEVTTDIEVDATQDEVRLSTGDQIFGTIAGADVEAVVLGVDGRSARVPWSEATGLYFRRDAKPGAIVSGLLVAAEWQAGADAREKDRIEGALAEVADDAITLATPYAGRLNIPRDRLTRLDVLGRGIRLVIDPKPHHLGDEVSVMAPVLDPPQPEGSVLERTFDLPRGATGEVQLVLDVVEVAGEGTDLPFSMLVKKGELRTNVAINGNPFDYLNRHIRGRNATPERIRLTIPRDQLRPGRNTIRFEQVGIANDPNYLDDLGILGIAVEVVPGDGR